MKLSNQVICKYIPTDYDHKLFAHNKAELPVNGNTYTVTKLFYWESPEGIRKSKWVFHLRELNHGTLVGYDTLFFYPADKNFVIKVSERESPKTSQKETKITEEDILKMQLSESEIMNMQTHSLLQFSTK